MRPRRNLIWNNEFAYFVSTQTKGRKPFFRHERWARLMLSTLNHYEGTGYKLHAYVVMPDHLHLLISPFESVEKALQLIKGGFSFRAKRELEWNGEIWQPGFTDHRIRDMEDWQEHLAYIRNNPVNAHMVSDGTQYEFMGMPSVTFPRGLKPVSLGVDDVRAKARILQPVSSLDSAGTAKAVPFQNTQISAASAEIGANEEVKENYATQK
jgi:putative transposase